jgi:hypothetical protein
MKSIFVHLSRALLLAFAALTLSAAETLPKFEKDIRAFEAADQTNRPPTGCMLAIGSSSIRTWKNIDESFPGTCVINRGFGGSHMSDAAMYVERIVVPYHPSLILVYAGDNDIKDGKTPERVLADFQLFVEKVHSALPHVPIGFISIKPSPSRKEFLDQIRSHPSN